MTDTSRDGGNGEPCALYCHGVKKSFGATLAVDGLEG